MKSTLILLTALQTEFWKIFENNTSFYRHELGHRDPTLFNEKVIFLLQSNQMVLKYLVWKAVIC